MVEAYVETFDSITDGSLSVVVDFVDASLVARFHCAVIPQCLRDKFRNNEVRAGSCLVTG